MQSPLRDGADLCQNQHSLPDSLIPSIVHALFDPSLPYLDKKQFLESFSQKGETAREIELFAEILLQKAAPFPIHSYDQGRPLFDCCGTGGGNLNLFNVSTALIPILASLGIPVVKHGNRGVTKKSGSADVIEALGIPLQLTPSQAYASLQSNGCVFLLAPAFHPHFKTIAPVRKQLGEEGKKTIFNLLGPLLNPARPKAQLLGLFQESHLPLFQSILTSRNTDFTIVLGRDPKQRQIGEVSPWGIQQFSASPLELIESLTTLHHSSTTSPEPLETLLVATAAESASMIHAVLSGKERGLARDIIVINATVALLTAKGAALFTEAKALVEASIDSGKALLKLKQWQEWRPQ